MAYSEYLCSSYLWLENCMYIYTKVYFKNGSLTVFLYRFLCGLEGGLYAVKRLLALQQEFISETLHSTRLCLKIPQVA